MNRYTLTMDKPSSWWKSMWREATPLGNGHIGASVYGAVYDETIMVTHEDLWWKGKTQPLPDVHEHLTTIREHLQKDDPEKARMPLCDALSEKGYDPSLAAPLPLCDLKIRSYMNTTFSHYNRTLDMSTGVATISYKDGDAGLTRKTFVSRADNLVICQIVSDSKKPFKLCIGLDFHDLNDAKVQANNIELSEITDLDAYLPQNKKIEIVDNYCHFSAQNEDGTDFGAMIKVIGSSVKKSKSSFQVTAIGEVLILLKPYVQSDRLIEAITAKIHLDSMTFNFETLLQRHIKLHKPLMTNTDLNLFGQDHHLSNESLLTKAYKEDMPITLLERMWLFGRYLLVSSTNSSGKPCPLVGLWCGDYQGVWTFNMLNENVQMIYWQALSGNMPELLLGVFDYYENMMDDFRLNAKNLFGCRGIYIPAATTPESGLLKLNLPHILHWTGGAGWLAQHYFDYYAYTLDEDFLRDRAYPFMLETIAFYEDFLIIDDAGHYTMMPSNSPENTPGNFYQAADGYEEGRNMETTVNATMDFAILKELLTNLISSEEILGIIENHSDKWKGMLRKIPAYQVNDDHTLKEWMYPLYEDNHHHRHLSHLYPVFPGREITAQSDPRLFDAGANTLYKRMTIGMKDQSGWSMAHLANCLSRVGDGDQSLSCLEALTRSCVLDNLFTTHNDWRSMGTSVDFEWAPIQVDANMGIVSAMNEMILQSGPGYIHILPARPTKWRKGHTTNMLAYNAIEVSILWDLDHSCIDITLLSTKKDLIIDLHLPKEAAKCNDAEIDDGMIKSIHLSSNQAYKLSFITSS